MILTTSIGINVILLGAAYLKLFSLVPKLEDIFSKIWSASSTDIGWWGKMKSEFTYKVLEECGLQGVWKFEVSGYVIS